MSELKTDYVNDELAISMGGKRRYRMIENSDGTVSFEDVTSYSVVGDEYDADDENIQAASGGYIMKGMTPLDDVCDLLGITIEDDFDTLNGFLISRLERIPRPGEQVDVKAEGYNFRIMAVKDNAVSQVKVTKIIT